MENYVSCVECKHFVCCDFGKQVFHKITQKPCDEFEKRGAKQ